ncbi:MAG TPA: hypothetical protein P5123_10250, partial [Spirochaetota bacterium]|nr:hypothetical protein [Spirochaetota bacterium]
MIQYGHSLFWYRLMMSLGIVAISIFLNLIIVLSGKILKPYYIVLIYLPAILAAGIYFMPGNPLSTVFYQNGYYRYYT